MNKYEYIVFRLIRIQEPKGGQPLSVEEMILNCRRLHRWGMAEVWHKSGVTEVWKELHMDEAVWRQITSMSASEVDKLLWWIADYKSILREIAAWVWGVDDPKDINLRD